MICLADPGIRVNITDFLRLFLTFMVASFSNGNLVGS